MNVRSPKPSDTKHGVTKYFRFTVDMFLFWNSYKFGVCMIEKKLLFICIHKWAKSIVFAVSIKFCDESGLAILNIDYINFILK